MATLRELIAKRCSRARMTVWEMPDDHLELTLIGEHGYGPWAHLRSPTLGEEGTLLLNQVNMDDDGWEPYEGPLVEKEGE